MHTLYEIYSRFIELSIYYRQKTNLNCFNLDDFLYIILQLVNIIFFMEYIITSYYNLLFELPKKYKSQL